MRRAALLLVLLGTATACNLLEEALAPRADAKLFFSIGDPQPGVPVGSFQDALDGWSYLFDISDPAAPRYECQHDDAEMAEKARLHTFPLATPEVCIPEDAPRVEDPAAPPFEPPPPGPPPFPPTHTGLAGMNPTPPDYRGWRGADQGGCGVWSTAMCDRRLGVTPPELQVVQGEWDGLAEALYLDAEGGSTGLARTALYRAYGYCVIDKEFGGSPADYEEVADNLDRCDVKLSFFRRTATGHAYGHVETVVSAGARSLVTNSWGKPAAVEGGSEGGFGHWQEGQRWVDDDGEVLWPPDSTDVFVMYVCPCDHPMMESLGTTILRSIGL